MNPPIITSVRIWLFDKSQWDDGITAVCPWCGQRFPVSQKILEVIRSINLNAGLTLDQSPCLELPGEAWNEPRLLSECPLCHKPLKFNPFIVDKQDINIMPISPEVFIGPHHPIDCPSPNAESWHRAMRGEDGPMAEDRAGMIDLSHHKFCSKCDPSIPTQQNWQMEMEEQLKLKVVGQDEAIAEIIRVVGNTRIILKKTGGPKAVFIFDGLKGVGKKTLAKALSEFLFGPGDTLLYLDMSEYSESHHVSRLMGPSLDYAKPDQGILSEWIRCHPNSMILMENIEKAHSDVLDLLRRLFLGEKLTDFTGQVIDVQNNVFIMTTNMTPEETEHRLINLRKFCNAEFARSIDKIVNFKPLQLDSVLKIASNLLNDLSLRLEEEQNISIEIDNKALLLIYKEGYDLESGVSQMRRTIDSLIITPLSKKVLAGNFSPGDKALVTARDRHIEFIKVT